MNKNKILLKQTHMQSKDIIISELELDDADYETILNRDRQLNSTPFKPGDKLTYRQSTDIQYECIYYKDSGVTLAGDNYCQVLINNVVTLVPICDIVELRQYKIKSILDGEEE